MEPIGSRIFAARKAAGYSQEEVGERLHIDRKTIGKWENGKTSPGTNDLERLSEMFNCDFGYLVGEYEEMTRPITDIREETGLSPEAIEVLRILKKYSRGVELQLISELIVCPVDDSIIGVFTESGTEELENLRGLTFFQALSNLFYQFKLLPADSLQKAGYLVLFQRLFTDFIERQLRKPILVDEDEE